MKFLKKIVRMGFAHIFSANLINKIVLFGINLVIVRLISKTEYGQYVYAKNILNMIMLLQGLGVIDGLLQYASETSDSRYRKAYLKFALKFGIIVNIILSVITIILSIYVNFKVNGANKIILILSLTPILYFIYNIILIYLRISLLNKRFSQLSIINTILYFILTIILGTIKGINGIIVSNYIAFIISIIIGVLFLKESDLNKKQEKVSLNIKDKQEFLKFSFVSSITNCISQLLYLLDTFLVGIIIGSSTIIAIYKNATLIPFNLSFIPLSIAIFIYPYFAANNKNKLWIKEKYIKLVSGLFIVNLFIVIILYMFSPEIISLLFGEGYIEAVPTFRILLFGYLISGTFRIPAGNILFSLKKVKINFYNSIITGIINIILDILLIYNYGHIGAAIATVSVFIISSIISNCYIIYYLKDEK